VILTFGVLPVRRGSPINVALDCRIGLGRVNIKMRIRAVNSVMA
jgi:hypothetical protein